MKDIERRIVRIEAKVTGAGPSIANQHNIDGMVDFVRRYHAMANAMRVELAERGRDAVVRRMLAGGSELERLALLDHLEHCPHTLMLLYAMEDGDPSHELLAWWREASPRSAFAPRATARSFRWWRTIRRPAGSRTGGSRCWS